MTSDPEKHSLNEKAKEGAFKRSATKFHKLITADGSSGFKAEPNRYHLYVSYACPWAHRTLIVRKLKGLEDVIEFSVVDPFLRNFGTDKYVGWEFNEHFPDHLHDDVKSTWDLYKKADPNYPASYLSVPILWDKKSQTIVNNESAMIIEMFNSEFNEYAKNPKLDLSPKDLKKEMDDVNDWIYPNINDGVYRCGFSKSQEAYDEAYDNLFNGMERLENLLSKQKYLCGNVFTLSDVRAFTTLARFDSVYYNHFKCNKKRVIDYPNIWGYVREIYQMKGVKETVRFDHIKFHYFHSHRNINPTGIVPKGPEINFDEPHGRS